MINNLFKNIQIKGRIKDRIKDYKLKEKRS